MPQRITDFNYLLEIHSCSTCPADIILIYSGVVYCGIVFPEQKCTNFQSKKTTKPVSLDVHSSNFYSACLVTASSEGALSCIIAAK